MRNLILFFILLPFLLTAQPPGFIHTYYKTGAQSEISTYQDLVIDQDTIVYYSFSFNEQGKQGVRFVKVDTFGNILQEVMYFDPEGVLSTGRGVEKLIQTSDGGYAMMGSIIVEGVLVLYFLKVNHYLEIEFLKKYPSDVDRLNTTLIELPDGFFLVGAQQVSSELDFCIIKTDKEGHKLWEKVYGDSGTTEGVLTIMPMGDEYLILAERAEGGSGQSSYGNSLWYKIDGSGEVTWTWEDSMTSLNQVFTDGVMLSDSSWMFMGGTWEWEPGPGGYTTRPMLIRTDKDLNVIWKQVFGTYVGNLSQYFEDITQTADGNFLVSGNIWDVIPDEFWESRAFHYKFSIDGDSIWARHDTILEDAYVKGTALLSSGSIISVGYADNVFKTPKGSFGFLMKIGADGCVDTLDCWSSPTTAVDVLYLGAETEIFPNPFQDDLTLTLQGSIAEIYFYDSTGHFLRKQKVKHGDNVIRIIDLPYGMLFYEVIGANAVTVGHGKLIRFRQ